MRQVTIQQADSKAEELTVLKANLHTHTTNSDGTFPLRKSLASMQMQDMTYWRSRITAQRTVSRNMTQKA